MPKMPEVETLTTVRCGEVAGVDVRIIHNRGGTFVKLTETQDTFTLTFTLAGFMEVGSLVTAGILKLSNQRV